jgi:hypothetical protein
MADRRIGTGPLLSLLGAALTALSLWLHWYRVDFSAQIRGAFRAQGGEGLGGQLGSALGEAFAKGFGQAFGGLLPRSIVGNGWQVLHSADVVLLAGAAAVAVVVLAGERVNLSGADAARLARIAGPVLGALVVYEMIDRTGPHEFVKLAIGPWVALAGCALITIGGLVGPPRELAPAVVFMPPLTSEATASVPPPHA